MHEVCIKARHLVDITLKYTQMSKILVKAYSLPPVLRSLKKELLEKRRELPPEVKSRAHVRYLRQWPYVELSMGKNKTSIRPSTTQRAIVQKFLGSAPLSVSLNFGETKLL